MQTSDLSAAAADERESYPFQFHGQTGEYFRIWIVNVLLTVITLGAFSAWAKVRNHRYFYGNTTLHGANFEYTANPVKILIVRIIIVFTLLGGAAWAGEDDLRSISYLPLLIILLSWALVYRISFNARHSLHRNVPFGFKGGIKNYLTIYLVFIPLILWTLFEYFRALNWGAAIFSHTPLGELMEHDGESLNLWAFVAVIFLIILSLPFIMRWFHRFKAENHGWGGMQTGFAARGISSYMLLYWVMSVLMVFFAVMVDNYFFLDYFRSFDPDSVNEDSTKIIFIVSALSIFLLWGVPLFAITYAKSFRLYWESLVLGGGGRVRCEFGTFGFALKIITVNFFARLFSLGLLTPWAKIRRARYLAANMALELPAGEMDRMLAAAKERESIMGEAADERGSARGEAADERESYPFQFHGQTGEYFRIWIVNVLLTVITLGAFSAWAKVRNRRYFYGNTTLHGANFEYIASPVKILIARIIVVVVLLGGTIWAGEDLLRNAYHSLLLVFLLPWALVRGLSFNARYSLHRNVPFGFKRDHKSYLSIYFIFIPFILWTLFGYFRALNWDAVVLLSTPLGEEAKYDRRALFYYATFIVTLSLPFVLFGFHRFKAENHRWGVMRAEFLSRGGVSSYIFPGWVIPVAIGLLFVFGVWLIDTVIFDEDFDPDADRTNGLIFIAAVAVVYVLIAVPLYGIMYAKLFRMYWESLVLEGEGRVRCEFSTVRFAMKIVTVNFFAKVLSLGLLTPWAKIRRARYLAATMVLEMPASTMDRVLAAVKAREGALGAEFEAAEGLGFDFGLV